MAYMRGTGSTPIDGKYLARRAATLQKFATVTNSRDVAASLLAKAPARRLCKCIEVPDERP
jgi:hypothetical protein